MNLKHVSVLPSKHTDPTVTPSEIHLAIVKDDPLSLDELVEFEQHDSPVSRDSSELAKEWLDNL